MMAYSFRPYPNSCCYFMLLVMSYHSFASFYIPSFFSSLKTMSWAILKIWTLDTFRNIRSMILGSKWLNNSSNLFILLCFDLHLNNPFFQISGTRIGRILTSKDQLARHPRMVNSSEEDTQSPVFDRDIANANANADSANEIITVEHNKRGFDAIPQPTENLS